MDARSRTPAYGWPSEQVAHHRRRVHVGNGVGHVGDQLGNRGGAAALQNFDVEPFLLVEALVQGDEERRVLAVERPIQTELELVQRLRAS